MRLPKGIETPAKKKDESSYSKLEKWREEDINPWYFEWTGL